MAQPRLLLDADRYESDYGVNSTQTSNLVRGQNIVTVDKNTPFNVLNIDGRTLVNLLGRFGGFESGYTGNLGTNTVTASFDTTSYTQGSQSAKLTTTAATGSYGYEYFQKKASAYYVGLVDVKFGSGTNAAISLDGYSNTGSASVTTNTSGFTTIYATYAPTTTGTGSFNMLMSGATGSYAWFDGARLYEITQTEYNAINSGTYTYAQMIAKYPYVDDVKHVQNPYLIKSGQNLLPPFQEWTLHANATAQDSYNLKHVSTVTTSEQSYYDIPVVVGQQYTFNFLGNGKAIYIFIDNTLNLIGNRMIVSGGTSRTVTVPSGATYIRINIGNLSSFTDEINPATYTYAAGTYTFTNPMLNIGSTALPFTPQLNNYLFTNTTLASSVDGSVKDYAYFKSGQYYKSKRFVTDYVLDGSLTPLNVNTFSNGATVKLQIGGTKIAAIGLEKVVKYDGKILNSTKGTWDTADYQGIEDTGSTSYIWISTSSTDTGWGSSSQSNTFSGTGSQTAFTLTPPANTSVIASTVTATIGGTSTTAFTVSGNTVTFTTAPVTGTNNVVISYTATYVPTVGEIQAYFWGWKMSASNSANTPYTGAGNKYWCVVTETNFIPANFVNANATPTAKAGTIPSYKLTYQLAQQQEELIQFEGDLQLHSGGNQIEYGEGVIVREKANTLRYTGGGTTDVYRINDGYTDIGLVKGSTTNSLKNKALKIISIYKNGTADKGWTIFNNSTDAGYAYGSSWAEIKTNLYDPTAEYTVSYIVLQEGQFRSNVFSGSATYNTNLRNIVNQISQNLTDVTTAEKASELRYQNFGVKGLGERIEKGAYAYSGASANGGTQYTLTFSRSFSSAPIVLATTRDLAATEKITVQVMSVTTTGCILRVFNWDTVIASGTLDWIAIGT